MIEALFQGLGLGVALSLSLGPVFFALIQTSINNGVKAGVLMAIGIMISDTLYILITYFGISILTIDKGFEEGLGIVGGTIMIVFGITTFLKKPMDKSEKSEQRTGMLSQYTIKGFALNGINPFVLIFWIGVSIPISISSYTPSEAAVYFVSIITVVFATDISKVFLAHKLRKYINPERQLTLNKLVGTGLLAFGVYMIVVSYLGKI